MNDKTRNYAIAVIAFVLLLCPLAMADATYQVTGLGFDQATGINDSGMVAGWGGDNSRAYTWSASAGLTDLGMNGVANAINNSGNVTGTGALPTMQAFIFSSATGLQALGTLTGLTVSFGLALNGSGQVVGYSSNGVVDARAFLYSSSTGMVDIGTLGGATAIAYGINDSGTVVGTSRNVSGVGYAFSYTTSGGMKSLGKLNFLDSGSSATAINNLGQIVGNSAGKAFCYSDSTGMVNIGLFAGALNGYPQDINEDGEIVGYSQIQLEEGYGNRAFYFSPLTGAIDLNTLIDPASGWTLIEATGINNLGQICGYGTNPSGQTEAFLLSPVPEPATVCLLAVGAAALLRRRKR